MSLSFRLRPAAVTLVAAVLAVGCGEERPPPAPPRDMAITFDAGDGGFIDGDAAVEDLGVPHADASVVTCHVEGEALTLATDVVDNSVRFADVAVSGPMFAVAWTDARSGVADAYVYAWPSGAPTGTEIRITDDFSPTRDVRIVPRADGFTVAWVDTTAGSFEVFARPLGSTGALESTAKQLTHNELREDSLSLASLAGGSTLAAWLESDGLGGPPIAYAVPLDSLANVVGTAEVATVPPRAPLDFSLTSLGTGAALAWTESGIVYLQPLTAAGAVLGDATVINTEGNASGTPALALGDSGGGVAFGALIAGARQEVRMRTVDAAGALVGPEAIVTPPPSTGSDPAIAPFAGGYVVASRTTAGASGSVRISFATALGEFSSSLEVAATGSTLGSGPRLAIAADGRMLVAWMETDGTTATFRAARVVCD